MNSVQKVLYCNRTLGSSLSWHQAESTGTISLDRRWKQSIFSCGFLARLEKIFFTVETMGCVIAGANLIDLI
jgi:hypothetical protein